MAGQQASGIQALINLQCRAHSLELPMIILEPVIPYNKFKAMAPLELNESGVPMLDQPKRDSLLQFSDIFDMELFNEMSSSMGYPELVERDFFFETAPQKIVFVVLYDGQMNEMPKMIKLWPKRNTPDNACFNPLSSQLSSDPKHQLYQLGQMGFCVIKVILFRMTRGEPLIFTELQFRKFILGSLSYGDFTLVFNVWMPKFVIQGTKGRECIHSGYHSAKSQVQPSQQLLASTKYYEDHFLKSNGNHLTLMIRLEHVYTYLRRPRSQYGHWTVEKCLDAAVEQVKEFQKQRSFGKPFVTLDIGKYGSVTLRSAGLQRVKNDTQHINRLLSSLYDGEWDLQEWENSFIQASGGIEDSSYIAALQRTLASKAECLILVGGGMFQELTLRKYMESHDQADWCIRFLCIKDKINKEVQV